MPVNRYGTSGTHHTGYSSVYGMYSFPKYSSMYTSSHSLGRCGSSSPALVRASTPSSTREPYSYSSIMSSVLPEERNYNSRFTINLKYTSYFNKNYLNCLIDTILIMITAEPAVKDKPSGSK